jgi:hypothetical protein
MRRVIAALIVVGLTIAVILLWPSPTAEIPPDTLAGATTTTTTTSPTTTTIVPDTTTTSAAEGSHVVETVEEAEEILRELWFGWFEGIYLQDEDRIREVVVLEETVETARESFGTEFARAPEPTDISFEESEILRSDDECLAVLTTLTLSGFREGESRGVEILRWTPDGWKSLSTWLNPNDLWEADCESSLF